MAVKILDARGWKCPLPTLRMLSEVQSMNKGDILEVVADCSTFEQDLRKFCEQTKKALLWLKDEGGARRCQLRV